LSELELRNAMAVLPMHPLFAEADALSATLPGDFDKLPVGLAAGQVTLCSGSHLSSHVLKPARPGLRESVFNEAFVMALAAAGLPVADCEIIHGQLAVLCVKRVDRRTDGPTRALHMEDFCQVVGLPATHKYQREGGLAVRELATLLHRYSCAPAQDLRQLMHWLLFSFLVGFGAAHAKQLALLYGAQGPRLAPFFGIWSTHVYNEMNHRLGFAIGGEDRPDWLTAARWTACAEDAGIRPAYLLEELRRLAQVLPRLAGEVAEQFQRRNGFANVIRQIRVLLEQRARQALVALEAERSSARAAQPRSA
jgi:serine/threonine-protein kinase HipA